MFLLAVGKGGSGHCLSSLTFTMSLLLYYRVLTNIPVWHVKCHLILISICIFLMAKPRFFLNHISIYLLNWSIHAKLVDFMEFSVRKTEKKMVINPVLIMCVEVFVYSSFHMYVSYLCATFLHGSGKLTSLRQWGDEEKPNTEVLGSSRLCSLEHRVLWKSHSTL